MLKTVFVLFWELFVCSVFTDLGSVINFFTAQWALHLSHPYLNEHEVNGKMNFSLNELLQNIDLVTSVRGTIILFSLGFEPPTACWKLS